jgi:hypothetical protein
MYKVILLVILFMLGMYIYTRRETWEPSLSTTYYNPYNLMEGFENGTSSSECPNLLIQNGQTIYLYNNSKPLNPGENPIEFSSLEQYVNYIGKQRMLGVNCPVLYLQKTMNAQGEDVYKVRSTPEDPMGGVPPPPPASSSSPPTSSYSTDSSLLQSSPSSNQDIYMDNLTQSIADNLSVNQIQNINRLEMTKSVLSKAPVCCPTQMDAIKPVEVDGKTADPMTPNWGGPTFSQNLINQGYYAGNEVAIRVN